MMVNCLQNTGLLINPFLVIILNEILFVSLTTVIYPSTGFPKNFVNFSLGSTFIHHLYPVYMIGSCSVRPWPGSDDLLS